MLFSCKSKNGSYLCFAVLGGDMGPEVHDIQIDDAPTTSRALDVGGIVPT